MGKTDSLRKLLRRGRRLAGRVRRGEPMPEATGPAHLRIGDQELQVEAGTTVLAAALKMGLDIDHYCGGHCSCGSCRIVVLAGDTSLSRPRPDEKMVLGHDAESRGDRLSCQARIMGDVTIEIPEFFMV